MNDMERCGEARRGEARRARRREMRSVTAKSAELSRRLNATEDEGEDSDECARGRRKRGKDVDDGRSR